MTKTKSPIKDKPLRYAAQSLDEALDDLLIDKVLIFYLPGSMCIIAAVYEWWRYFRPLERPPVASTVVFVGMTIFCVFKIVIHIKKMKSFKQGRDGERAVGQYLETFLCQNRIFWGLIAGMNGRRRAILVLPVRPPRGHSHLRGRLEL